MKPLPELTELVVDDVRIVPIHVHYADRRRAVVVRFVDRNGRRCGRARTFAGRTAVEDARQLLGALCDRRVDVTRL